MSRKSTIRLAGPQPDDAPREPAVRRPLGRRDLLRGTASGLAGLLLPGLSGTAGAQGRIAVESLSDRLSLLTGSGGNQLAVATGDGLVLVDSGAAADSTAVLATLTGIDARGVATLFNTHWHPDQVGANAALGAAGARIFGHEKTRQRLAAGYYLPAEDRYEAPMPASGVPNESFYTAGAIAVGGVQIDYGYLLEAHTDGDIYVAFPDLDVVAAGDVLAPDRDPVFDWYGGGWLGGRLDALTRLLEIGGAGTRYVPSYGPVLGRADVEAELAMLTTLFDRFVEHIRLGETARNMYEIGMLDDLGREFSEPLRLIDDLYRGFWAHHNTLMHDIV